MKNLMRPVQVHTCHSFFSYPTFPPSTFPGKRTHSPKRNTSCGGGTFTPTCLAFKLNFSRPHVRRRALLLEFGKLTNSFHFVVKVKVWFSLRINATCIYLSSPAHHRECTEDSDSVALSAFPFMHFNYVPRNCYHPMFLLGIR